MQYIAETREFQIKEKTVVSIGKFDGLHRGHQKLMHEMLKWKEQGFKIAVFTFATPPGTLVKGKMQTMIMTNPEREMLLEKAGVDYIVEYPFDEEVCLNDLIALGDGKPFYPVNLCNSLDKASQSARVVVPSQFVA